MSFTKENLRKICYKEYNKALRKKDLIRLDHCENCLVECKPHGHHPNHDFPLEVIWLCEKCHSKVHCDYLYSGEPYNFSLDTFLERTSKKLSDEQVSDLYERLKFNTRTEKNYLHQCTEEEKQEIKKLQNEYLNILNEIDQLKIKSYKTWIKKIDYEAYLKTKYSTKRIFKNRKIN